MTFFSYALEATDGAARAGTLQLPHGNVMTPAFMPVGTQGTVKGVSSADLDRMGAQIVLGNTYHLHVRPGEELIAGFGGLNSFMSWPKPLLTDSGGFQVFSLSKSSKIEEEGVTFKSHVDGSRRVITPEKSMEIQWALHPDIAMAFDHVIPGDADEATTRDAMDRSIRWLRRSRDHHGQLTAERPDEQTLWPIVQGGVFEDQRLESIKRIGEIGDWTGWAIGGLAVGETKAQMFEMLDLVTPVLPAQTPRYLMGVGFPDDLVRAIGRGVDLFDCVAPTRNGRHGSAFTARGRLLIKNTINRTSTGPIDEECDCPVCETYSRGYLRHRAVDQTNRGDR